MEDFIFCLIVILIALVCIFAVLGIAFDRYFSAEKMMKLSAGTFIFAMVIVAIVFLVSGIGSLFG